jgi:hypothetical protein
MAALVIGGDCTRWWLANLVSHLLIPPSITSQQDRDLHVTVKALAHDHMYDIAVIERPWPLARTWIAKAPLAISD